MQEKDISMDEGAVEAKPSKKKYLYSKIPLIGRISYAIFFLTILFVPIFFLPTSWGLQLEFAKKALLSLGILTAFALWLITKLEDGKVTFPGGAVFWSGLLLVISFLVSALFSSHVGSSLYGLGYENDTFAAIVLLFLTMFLASTYFESRKEIFKFFSALAIVSMLTAIFEIFQIFSPIKILAGGPLTNLIGRWNDLGIFFGMSLLLALVGLELRSFRGKRVVRLSLWALFTLSVSMLLLINYNLIWAVVGVFALVICIYSLAESGMFSWKSSRLHENEDSPSKKNKSFKNIVYKPSFFVVVASIVLFLGTNYITSFLNSYGISQPEVRPSWQSTIEVARSTMDKNLYFGTGPNSFSMQWAIHKPDAVNSTIFWNTEFDLGFGRIPSFAVTLGVFGLLASGIFILSLLYYGRKAISASFEDPADQFVILSSLVMSFYLWSFSIFYVTDTSMLVLTFVTTGIFLASLFRVGLIKEYGFSFVDNPKLGFASVLLIVLLVISVISASYLLLRKFTALYYFQEGIYNFNNSGDLSKIESSINSAVNMDEQDLYYRSLTDVYLARLRTLIAGGTGLSQQSLLAELQSDLTAAASDARKSTDIDPDNYLNWMSLGRVGETVMPLNNLISGSYDLAVSSYTKALSLNAKDPSIYLSLANVEVAKGNDAKAKSYLDQALAMKSNYTEALFLSSQIAARDGNLTDAINKAQQAATFAPDQVGVLFQLGLLKYMDKDYTGAATALKSATAIQPDFANAKYFLGLSYNKLGQNSEAIKEFEDIRATNPDNKEVQDILTNLYAGRGALDKISSLPKNVPKDPTKRSKPPIATSAAAN